MQTKDVASSAKAETFIRARISREITTFLTQNGVALDPLLPEAYLGLASNLTWQHFDFAAARPNFERAIELNPSYAEAHMFYSHYLGIVGELDKSGEHMRLALELDPMNPFVHALSGIQLVMIEEYEEAVRVAERVLEETPGFGFGYVTLSAAHQFLGNREASFQAFTDKLRFTVGRPEIADRVAAIGFCLHRQ